MAAALTLQPGSEKESVQSPYSNPLFIQSETASTGESERALPQDPLQPHGWALMWEVQVLFLHQAERGREPPGAPRPRWVPEPLG